jgi:hypothetical protein
MQLPIPRLTRVRILVVAGIATFLAGLVAGAPAALLAPLLAAGGVQAGSLRGTLWSGEVLRLTAGSLRVERLRWQLSPAYLLLARLQAEVDATLAGDGFANGTLSVRPGGLGLRGVTIAGPLAALLPAGAALGAAAELRVRVEAFDWRNDWVAAAVATAEVVGVDAGFGAIAGGTPPGSYTVTFAVPELAPGEPLTGDLRDTGGPLEVVGTIALAPPLQYTIEATAKARPDAPPDLVRGLTLLGPPDGAGRHAISFAGTL